MEQESRVIRVLVVDDDPLVRQALGLMLGGQVDIEVVGEAADGAAGLAAVDDLAPHVVLMDVRMPVLSGLAATKALQEREDPPAVIVLTTFDADEYVLTAVAAGASGFLLKDTPPAEIVEAVRRVAGGDAILSPSATRSLVARVRNDSSLERAAEANALVDTLTPREREVAVCVGRGQTNAEIAAELHLSVPTVKAHVSRLLEKLRAGNRVQIALRVYDAGLV